MGYDNGGPVPAERDSQNGHIWEHLADHCREYLKQKVAVCSMLVQRAMQQLSQNAFWQVLVSLQEAQDVLEWKTLNES